MGSFLILLPSDIDKTDVMKGCQFWLPFTGLGASWGYLVTTKREQVISLPLIINTSVVGIASDAYEERPLRRTRLWN